VKYATSKEIRAAIDELDTLRARVKELEAERDNLARREVERASCCSDNEERAEVAEARIAALEADRADLARKAWDAGAKFGVLSQSDAVQQVAKKDRAAFIRERREADLAPILGHAESEPRTVAVPVKVLREVREAAPDFIAGSKGIEYKSPAWRALRAALAKLPKVK